MELIDKDALVAEINKRIIDAPINNIGHQRVWAYNDIKDIIDTLEVKEMQEEPVSKDYRERYKSIAQSEAFKKTYEGMSVGEIMHVECEESVWIKELQDKLDSLSKEDFEKVWSKYSQYGKGEAPVSENLPHIRHRDTLDEFAYQCAYDLSNDWAIENPTWHDVEDACKLGAKWKENHLWKPADGDDLPEIDREVIALLNNGKVVFAHRPPEYWDGKNIETGKVTRYYPKTYDKGGWNIPDVKYWLDCLMPKEIEL